MQETELSSGDVARKRALGPHTYSLLVTAGKLYVSNCGDESITILDSATGKHALNFKTGGHPTDMLLHNDRLYVACANTNSVYVHDQDTGTVRERISVAL